VVADLETSSDRGNVSVEAAVLLPVLLLVFLVTVQLGTVFYARAVASSAARQGLDAARVADGSEAQGRAAARQFLTDVRAGLRNPAVVVDRRGDDVTVTVTSEVISVVPVWRPAVTVTVSASTEEVTE
jgi:Flp pilus assembly protein TadG